MEMKSRDKILFAALDLFSQKGYDGVGVDLIAEAAGFKGPSIYRHFKGKEDILNSLVEEGNIHYAEGMHTGELPKDLTELKEMSLGQINFTIRDPMIRKFRKMITMEQYRNEKMSELASAHFIRMMEARMSAVFAALIEQGLLKPFDPELLAMEYTAPVTLLIHECDRHPERETEVLEQIERHLEHFISVYGLEK